MDKEKEEGVLGMIADAAKTSMDVTPWAPDPEDKWGQVLKVTAIVRRALAYSSKLQEVPPAAPSLSRCFVFPAYYLWPRRRRCSSGLTSRTVCSLRSAGRIASRKNVNQYQMSAIGIAMS